ncbi:hypothetical protein A2141_00625 [Candidatus Woesebacteria bacterium RBG_16_40_11]|nr:MAG: hypothetical protein A2141_00625 [Candidatus Woesebacteria bacterium RBG_16_40_11]
MKKAYFEPVDLKINFSEKETELLHHLYEKGIVKKYLEKNKNSKKIFSFLDGPITANNPMGVHHAWGRTYKDVWQRYKNMRGYRQRFQNGFDCQGLWVEVEVEKELGLKSKKEIENLVPGDPKASVAKFIELCKARVYKYAEIQTEQTKRLGNFMDWENSYYTLSDDNNYMIWHVLKICHESGLIYKGRDSVPWCPRCGTAISQHEILTEDYKEMVHETVFFKVPIQSRDFQLLVWTTTPWTIPANVALAVNPKFIYKIWKLTNGEKIVTMNEKEIKEPESLQWFTRNIVESGFSQSTSTEDISGRDLVGLKYHAPFDDLERIQQARKENDSTFHSVVAAEDLVVSTKGTGILHVAPGAGEEDFRLGKEKNLPVIDVIDEEANYYEGLGEFSRQNAKKHPEIIINYLKEKDGGKFLLKTANITHRYPACWRCKTELVWRVVDEWYIAMDKPLKSSKNDERRTNNTLREAMIEVAKKITWIPGFGLERELDWLKNMHDWLISKKRYWGLALPIWECSTCGNFEVIGNYSELKVRATAGWDKFDRHSPHKPWIDEVKITCSKCKSVINRIPDVGNPWLDAGIVPFSTVTQDNKGEPLYLKNKEVWRKWIPADFITESFPGQFKNWFYSLIAMSTILEQKEPFKTVLGFATLFAENGQPMHKSAGNMIEFNEGAERIGVDVMRWMYLRQNPVDNLLFGYGVGDETRRKFHLKIWNVYNFFITYANLDGWSPSRYPQPVGSPNKNSKTPKLQNSKNALDRWILSRLKETLDVTTHYMDSFDAFKVSGVIESFVDDLSNWYIRRSRERVGASYSSNEDRNNFYETTYFVLVNLMKMLAPFIPFMADLIFSNLTKEPSVHLADWLDIKFKSDDALVDTMKGLRMLVEKVHAERKVQAIPVRQPLNSLATAYSKPSAELEVIVKDEINVKIIDWSALKGEEFDIKLDTTLTPDLIEEAKTRELIRTIQSERKKLGVELDQKVNITSNWYPDKTELKDMIIKKALIKELNIGDNFKVEKAA